MIKISPPATPAGSQERKILQLYSYLFQMSEQLNAALSNLEGGSEKGKTAETAPAAAAYTAASNPGNNRDFETLRAMIVKTADVVEAQMDVLTAELRGSYVAKSEFGQYTVETQNKITATSEAITQQYTRMEMITDELDSKVKAINGYIKAGILDEDKDEDEEDIVGIEVGEVNNSNFKARFTSKQLSFLQNGEVVAYISNKRLHITEAEIKKNLKIGNFQIDGSDNGFTIRYVGPE